MCRLEGAKLFNFGKKFRINSSSGSPLVCLFSASLIDPMTETNNEPTKKKKLTTAARERVVGGGGAGESEQDYPDCTDRRSRHLLSRSSPSLGKPFHLLLLRFPQVGLSCPLSSSRLCPRFRPSVTQRARLSSDPAPAKLLSELSRLRVVRTPRRSASLCAWRS